MAYEAAVDKLKAPIKDLVLAATGGPAASSSEFAGTTDNDKAEVANWIERIGRGEVPRDSSGEGLQELDAELTPRTYLVNNRLTAADVALYGSLHPIVSKLQSPQYYATPAITRYFDHIQSIPSIRKSSDALSPPLALVTFDLDHAPPLTRTADAPKKKEKKPAPAGADATAAAASAEKPAAAKEDAPTEKKKEKKEKAPKAAPAEGATEKAQKKGGGGKAAAPAAAEDAGEPVPSMIDLRVGHIVDIMKHPDADGLYVEQIDFGEETGPRTVVSGLVHYIPIEQMRDKYLVGVCNLKPANMRGVKSFAMVLCATSKEGKEGGIELIQPPAGSKPGERVYFEGGQFEAATPLSQLNPKKKIFETIQPGFITLDTKEAAWVNPSTKSVHKIRTKDGFCVAPTLIGASLS